MKDFFLDVFEYHHHFNQKLADQLTAEQVLVNEKMISLFSHIINSHQIWNARILGLKTLGVNDLHSLKESKTIDDSNYENTVKTLDKYELDSIITYRNSKGDEFENSIQQILFHVANHTTHHRGQIISGLRSAGIDPLVTDYIFYKR